jgi:hypothetical protein
LAIRFSNKRANEHREKIMADQAATDNSKIDLSTVYVGTDGKLVTINPEDADRVVSAGYRPATKNDILIHNYLESPENKGIGGAIKVATRQFINQALSNVPETIANYSDSDLEKAKYDMLKKEHSFANIAGGIPGFVLNALAMGGVFKGASAVLANRLASTAIDTGMEVAPSAFNKVAGGLLKSGVEGAAFMAPQAITESYFGDHKQAAESLFMGAGLAAALHGIIAGGKFAADKSSDFIKTHLIKGIDSSESGKAFTNSANAVKEGSSIIDEAVNNANPRQRKDILESLRIINERRTKNGEEPLGITPGMQSKYAFTKELESSLEKGQGVFSGVAKLQKSKIMEQMGEEAESYLNERTNKTPYEIGTDVQNTLVGIIKKDRIPAEEPYEQAREEFGSIPYPEGFQTKAIKKIEEMEEYTAKTSTAPGKVIDGILGTTDLDGFRRIRTRIGRMFSNTFKTKEDEITISKLYKILTDLRKDFIDGIEDFTDEQKERLNFLYKEGDKRTAEVRKKHEPLDYAIDKKLSGSINDLEEKYAGNELRSLNASKYVHNLFSGDDIKKVRYIKKNFPEVWEIMKNQRITDIYDASFKEVNGEQWFSVAKFFSQLDKIPKEIKNEMFSKEALELLPHMKTIASTLPKDINPSGTSGAYGFMHHLFSPIMQAYSLGHFLLLHSKIADRAANALPVIQTALKKTAKGLDSFDKVIKGEKISLPITPRQAVTAALSRLLYGHEDNKNHGENFEKVSDAIARLNDPNTKKVNSHLTSALGENGAPNIAALYEMQLATALKYLQDMIPKNPNAQNLVKGKWVPNDAQLSKFDRIARVIDNPFSVIQDFQEGKVSSDSIAALAAVFPSIYAQMVNRIIKYAQTEDLSKIDYTKLLQLGTILQNHNLLDNNNKHINILQNNFNSIEAHQQPGANKPTHTRKGTKFTASTNFTTDAQRVMYKNKP